MNLPRIIPCLLLQDRGLVKTVRFKAPVYLGDPRNIVRLFNDKEADELILLDIAASRRRRPPDRQLIEEIVSECFMPVCYGGGVASVEQIGELLWLGVEKVAINTAALETPELIRAAADKYGSQSIVVAIDVRRNLWGRPRVYSRRSSPAVPAPLEWARRVEQLGAGEILLTAVDRDGMRGGYDLELIRQVTAAVSIPVIASGGAAGLPDLVAAIRQGGAAAAAAGSMFVFQGRQRGVLVSYPARAELENAFMDLGGPS